MRTTRSGSVVRRGGQWVPADEAEGTAAATATVEAPAKSASRGEWDDYARSQGVDPDEFSSKDALIDALG